ncbi:MAG: hypothetical protein HYY64_14915 [Candidatus Rokubacteria bacterium]|nr:hypothetical protein [Candidatus Rokubacteria bacterium]
MAKVEARRVRIAVVLGMLMWVATGTMVLAQVPGKPTGTPLTGAELKNMFERGAIIDHYHPGGIWRGSTVVDPSGLVFANWLEASGVGGQDLGTWRMVGDTFCLKYKTVRGGMETCFRHYKVGDNTYQIWLTDGRFNSAYRLRP